MSHDHSHHDPDATRQGSFWTSKAFLVCIAFAAMAVVLLWKEHQAHILGIIPYLFLLACPLMHIFMHGGHGGHHHGGGTPTIQPPSERAGGKS